MGIRGKGKGLFQDYEETVSIPGHLRVTSVKVFQTPDGRDTVRIEVEDRPIAEPELRGEVAL